MYFNGTYQKALWLAMGMMRLRLEMMASPEFPSPGGRG
jgi:hypothetical protein